MRWQDIADGIGKAFVDQLKALPRVTIQEFWDGGYGAFWDGEKVVRAHVWLYRQLIGEIPVGQVLFHDCDNRRCVNVVAHIYPGTQKQNVQDMIEKGRASFSRESS